MVCLIPFLSFDYLSNLDNENTEQSNSESQDALQVYP
jgi:hypothetical protein